MTLPVADSVVEEHEALLQFLYMAPIGLVQTTLDGDVVLINPISARLLMPLSRDGSLDNLFAVLSDVAPGLRERVGRFREPSGVICDALRIRLDTPLPGGARPQVLSIGLFKLDAARLMVVLDDVTLDVERERQDVAARLSVLARTDALTQLPNRVAVRERLQRAVDRGGASGACRVAVFYLNCDRFKQINDTLGAAAGDVVLVCIGERLRAALGSGGPAGRPFEIEPMVARVGGDEFVVVVEDPMPPAELHAIARELIASLDRPHAVGRHELHCSVSMGVRVHAPTCRDADAMLRDASIAMVEAKRAGGARHVVFEPTMQDRAARRATVEAELRQALLRGELFVVYQPVVELTSQGRACRCGVAGVEALVRWRQPARGLVPPGEFIGIAEECGLIDKVGGFVLATACSQFVEWQATLGERAPRFLAVNLSRAQLRDPGLAAEVRRTLELCGMEPERLQFEVTESLAAQDEIVQARLHELKALGLTLALDDFGTGYSSLASLHQLPVDTVKIDRSFVSQADASRHHRALIDATIRVAVSLGMSTVAEGIETAAQAAVVRELGCHKGQGFLFGKPRQADELARWLVDGASAQLHSPGGSPATHGSATDAPSAQASSPSVAAGSSSRS